MGEKSPDYLSRREREIMDVIYRLKVASAAEVRDALKEPPSYSAVRAMLRILEEKGHLRHDQDGLKYVFRPTVSKEKAQRSVLKRMLDTFFEGSTERAVASLLDVSASKMSAEQFDRLADMIEKARKEGR